MLLFSAQQEENIMAVEFVQVDAFTHRPLYGNPAASGGKLLRMTQGAPGWRDAGLPRAPLARMLGCVESDLAATPCEVVSTGVPWLVVELSRLAAISALNPDLGLIARECKRLKAAGVTVFAERGQDGPVRLRVRTFAPARGCPKIRCADPATARSRPLSPGISIREKRRGAMSPSRALRSAGTARLMHPGSGTVRR
nr:PhzF family phenazine biosynthesis protein [Zobellella endophytica]